jgi:protocatechuate 3,4-dioxygenase beta subunit
MHGKVTRRGSLLQFGGFVAATLGLRSAADAEASAGPTAVATGAVTCVLAPEQTEGPFYVAGAPTRRNVTEGRPGTPLALRLTVVSASTCKPIRGASVEIWHCDAGGAYSGSAASNPGTTFLRGVQRTNANGVALFDTIYPGWYPGRAVHVHVKVHVGGNVVHTGQLYFSDAVTDKAHTRTPYKQHGQRVTRNGDDAIFVNGGRRSLLRTQAQNGGTRYVASIVMGVQR